MTVVLQHQADVIRAIPIAVDRHEVEQANEVRRCEWPNWRAAIAWCDERGVGIYNDGCSRQQAINESSHAA